MILQTHSHSNNALSKSLKSIEKNILSIDISKAQFNANLKLNKAHYAYNSKSALQIDPFQISKHSFRKNYTDYQKNQGMKRSISQHEVQITPSSNMKEIMYNLNIPYKLSPKNNTNLANSTPTNSIGQTFVLTKDILEAINLNDPKKALRELKKKYGLNNFQLPILGALTHLKNSLFVEKNEEKSRSFVFSKIKPRNESRKDVYKDLVSAKLLEKINETSFEKMDDNFSTHRSSEKISLRKNIQKYKTLMSMNPKNMDNIYTEIKTERNKKLKNNRNEYIEFKNAPMKIYDQSETIIIEEPIKTPKYNTIEDQGTINRNSSKNMDDIAENKGSNVYTTDRQYFEYALQSEGNVDSPNIASSRSSFRIKKIRTNTYDKSKFSSEMHELPKKINSNMPTPRKFDIVASLRLLDEAFTAQKNPNKLTVSQLELFNRSRISPVENIQERRFFADNGVEFFNINPEKNIAPYLESRKDFNRNKKTLSIDKNDKPTNDFAPILAEYDENTTIIQPEFMKQTGTMCFTEFWSDKDKKQYTRLMKGSLQTIKIHEHQELVLGGGLYKPGKIKVAQELMNRIISQQNAHGNEYSTINKPTYKRYTLKNQPKDKLYKNDINIENIEEVQLNDECPILSQKKTLYLGDDLQLYR